MTSVSAPAWRRWYVVQTKPRKEDLVRVQLEQNGMEVFLPLVLEWSRGRRRVREQTRYMFPGYIFVRMSIAGDYPRVRWTPGVRGVLGPGGCPTAVEDSLVGEISARLGRRGYVLQRPDIRSGDRVEIRHGPFAGLLGVVESPSTARERVKVLLTLFDRRTSVEMDGRDLVRLGNRC